MNFQKGLNYLVNQAIDDFENNPKKFKENKFVPIEFFYSYIKELQNRSITWDISDFEQRARENESSEFNLNFSDFVKSVPQKYRVYNRKAFDKTLMLMIKEHDCNNGISWETVDFYLDEYCR